MKQKRHSVDQIIAMLRRPIQAFGPYWNSYQSPTPDRAHQADKPRNRFMKVDFSQDTPAEEDSGTRKQNRVLVRANCGLGNRLRALVSGIYLSHRFDFPLLLSWPANKPCDCRFQDLFQNEIEQIIVPKHKSQRECYEEILEGPIRYYGERFARLTAFKGLATVPESPSDFDGSTHIAYNSPQVLSFLSQPELGNFLRELRPNKQIADNVQLFCSDHQIDSRTYGVHIRRTDLATHDDAYYLDRMKGMLCSDPSSRFFVCSDSEETEQRIAAELPGRVTTKPKQSYVKKGPGKADWHDNAYRDRQSVIEALEDMLILARSNFCIRSNSSFSEVAAWWGDQTE